MRIGIGGEGFGENLDGDGAIEPRVAGAIHLAHAAFADWRNYFVGPEFYPGCDSHSGLAGIIAESWQLDADSDGAIEQIRCGV